jgi:magnesium transporter
VARANEEGFVLEGEALRQTTDLEDLREAYARGATVWVDLAAQTAEADALLSDSFGLHALTLEDLWGDCEQPKIEDFGPYVHVVAHTVTTDKDLTELVTGEVDLVIGARFIVTHGHDRALFDRIREDVRRTPRLLGRGPAWIAHAVLDLLVDAYLPLIDRYDEQIGALEREVVEVAGTPQGPRVMARIFALKRTLQLLRRGSIHQRQILLRLARGEFDEIPREVMPFFRDVHDHFLRVTDLVESYRELLSNALEAYLSVQSNRMNEIMKTLTTISTVMLPLTFIAGVYGMNFKHMPELEWPWGYGMAIALMLSVALSIVGWFRHKKWL